MNSIQFNFILDSFICLSGYGISDKNCFFPVSVSNENLTTISEKGQLPIPSSLIKMNDRDKIKLELILFDDALHSAGLDFGFLKKAEKEAMKKELKEAYPSIITGFLCMHPVLPCSDSIEEKLCTKSEKDFKDLESFE